MKRVYFVLGFFVGAILAGFIGFRQYSKEKTQHYKAESEIIIYQTALRQYRSLYAEKVMSQYDTPYWDFIDTVYQKVDTNIYFYYKP